MRITRAREIEGDVFLVHVDPGEIVVPSGKIYPHHTCIGTFDLQTGKINGWTPAGYVPRGFVGTARALLKLVSERRYYVATIHEGTAIGVMLATPAMILDPEDEKVDHATACKMARASAADLRCQWFDLTMGGYK